MYVPPQLQILPLSLDRVQLMHKNLNVRRLTKRVPPLSGGKTTAVNNNPLTSGVGFCWCNCNVDWPSAHNWPVRRSSWCGRHDCRASVPNNPSEPILATTQHILHFSPGKTTSKSIWPTTVNGDESADTSRHVHRRILDFTCGWAVHIFSKTDVANIVT